MCACAWLQFCTELHAASGMPVMRVRVKRGFKLKRGQELLLSYGKGFWKVGATAARVLCVCTNRQSVCGLEGECVSVNGHKHNNEAQTQTDRHTHTHTHTHSLSLSVCLSVPTKKNHTGAPSSSEQRVLTTVLCVVPLYFRWYHYKLSQLAAGRVQRLFFFQRQSLHTQTHTDTHTHTHTQTHTHRHRNRHPSTLLAPLWTRVSGYVGPRGLMRHVARQN